MNKGIDISEWQRGISFKTLKDKVDFVIIRAGFTGTSDGITKVKDSSFEDFYKEAKNENIKVGAYWYSCANTREKGISEANFMYENCLKGKKFEYPIYIDVEESKYQTVGKEKMSEAIIGFCKTLEEKGYYAGVYANLNYFDNYIATDKLTKYDKWVAYWSSTKPEFKYGSYSMWQNSSSGYIGGFRLDTDIAYKDFPAIMKKEGLNGYKKEEDNDKDDDTCKNELLEKDKKIKELQEENALLNKEIEQLKKDNLKDLEVFTSPSNDNYYIYLKKDEKVYFSK